MLPDCRARVHAAMADLARFLEGAGEVEGVPEARLLLAQ